MLNTIEIREAQPNDYDEIYRLIKEFSVFQKTPEKVTITPSQMREDSEIFNCLLAIDNDKIIGFATYFYAYYSWSGKALNLDDLYVIENYRKNGVGNLLLDTIIQKAKTENCKNVRWFVSNWNTKAIDFYKYKGAFIDDTEMTCNLKL